MFWYEVDTIKNKTKRVIYCMYFAGMGQYYSPGGVDNFTNLKKVNERLKELTGKNKPIKRLSLIDARETSQEFRFATHIKSSLAHCLP